MRELRPLNLKRLNLAFDGKKLGVMGRMTTSAYRARVAGGWLVVVFGTQGMSGIAFYPDPQHEWDGGSND